MQGSGSGSRSEVLPDPKIDSYPFYSELETTDTRTEPGRLQAFLTGFLYVKFTVVSLEFHMTCLIEENSLN